MIKRLVQSLIPSFILNRYKKNQYYKILKDFNIKDQPDLLIAEKLIEENSVFIDIGANIGLYTKHLSPLVNQVYAFEPVPFTFSMLFKNIEKFKLVNVELSQIAISSRDGEAPIEVPIQGGARNYYRASLEVNDSTTSSQMKITVPTKTIDSLFTGKTNEISFIKIDVEGHELSVINGAKEFLTNTRCAWLIEIAGNPDEENDSAFEVFKKMKVAGFTGYFFDGEVLQQRKKGDTSVNYFFLKKHHLNKLSAGGVVINN